MLCILLCVYHALVWNRILQYSGRGLLHILLLHILLLCLLRGRLCRGGGKISRVFQPFEIYNLGAMVGVMTVHATKSTRVDGFDSIPPLASVVIAPLGVLVPLVLVAPRGLVLWGMVPALTRIVVIPVLSFPPVIVCWMRWVGGIQLFKILVLLSSGRLNKIHVCMGMWGCHGLWRARKGEVWILWWY
jgi:hypothetical protein